MVIHENSHWWANETKYRSSYFSAAELHPETNKIKRLHFRQEGIAVSICTISFMKDSFLRKKTIVAGAMWMCGIIPCFMNRANFNSTEKSIKEYQFQKENFFFWTMSICPGKMKKN